MSNIIFLTFTFRDVIKNRLKLTVEYMHFTSLKSFPHISHKLLFQLPILNFIPLLWIMVHNNEACIILPIGCGIDTCFDCFATFLPSPVSACWHVTMTLNSIVFQGELNIKRDRSLMIFWIRDASKKIPSFTCLKFGRFVGRSDRQGIPAYHLKCITYNQKDTCMKNA